MNEARTQGFLRTKTVWVLGDEGQHAEAETCAAVDHPDWTLIDLHWVEGRGWYALLTRTIALERKKTKKGVRFGS